MSAALKPKPPVPHPGTLKLYEFADAYRRVLDECVDDAGEITAEFEARIGAIDDAFDTKVERTILFAQELAAESEAVASEVKRLQARARVNKNAAERLKAYVQHEMEVNDRPRVETPRVKVSIVNNSRPSFDWHGRDDMIPEPYRKVTYSWDDAELLAYWKQNKHAVPDPNFEAKLGKHLLIK